MADPGPEQVFGGVWRGCDDAQGAVSEGEARPAALRQGPPLCPPQEEATVQCTLPGLVSAGSLGLLILEQGGASVMLSVAMRHRSLCVCYVTFQVFNGFENIDRSIFQFRYIECMKQH